MTFLLGAALLALFAAAGCGDAGQDRPSGKRERARVHATVQGVVKAYGGAATLGKVHGYRAEGILTSARRREQADVVRWFERPDRMRVETRYPDHGEIRVAADGAGWAGPDDLHLQALSGPILEAMLLEAVRLDLPLRLAEQESSLVWMPPDAAKRTVLRMPLADGLAVDYHVHPRSHHIERVEMRLPGPSATRFAADLSEFRWVHGVLFPFREDAYAGETRTAVLRFRAVAVNPQIAPELLAPVTPP